MRSPVTHRKSAPLSSLVRPGAMRLTAEVDPCFSIPVDPKPLIATAALVLWQRGNVLQSAETRGARLTSWIHILHFQPSHDTNFADSLVPSNKMSVVRLGHFSSVLSHVR